MNASPEVRHFGPRIPSESLRGERRNTARGHLALATLWALLAACASDAPPPPGPGPDPATLARVLKEAAAFHTKGRGLLEGGKAGEAITPLQQAIRLGRRGHEVHGELGRALLAVGQVHEARGAFGMALSLKPGEVKLLTLLGQAQLKSGYPRQALASLRAALKKKPGDAAITTLLARARAEAAQQGKAKDLIGKGSTLASEGKHSDAVKAFSEAARDLPQNVDANLGLAESLCKLKRFSEAIAPLRKVTMLSNRNSDAFFLLGVALASVGKKKEASEQLERAMDMRMHDVEFHLRAAGELVAAKQLDEAAKLLARGISFKMQSPQEKARQLCALWLVQEKLGKKDRAAATRASIPRAHKASCDQWRVQVEKGGWR